MKSYSVTNIFFTLIIVSTISLQSCVFMFNNDSSGEVIIHDSTSKSLTRIAKNRSSLLGDPLQHATCKVYQKQRGSAKWKEVFQFAMTACAKPGTSPSINYSDLVGETLPKEFQLESREDAPKAPHCSACAAHKK